ncbi:MAG: hypothetical protein M0P70_17845 [Desulfobulbaceae bacterium]|nr:hypothetical protein [Desulfobulbaceae bacterium]
MADSDAILNDYRASIREINRLLLVGLFFALAAHLYVIEPYFQLKSREQALQGSLPAMEQSVKALSREEVRINEAKQSATSALQQIRQQLIQFPDQLRNALPDIREALSLRNIPLSGPSAANAPDLPPYNQYAQQQQYMQQPLPRTAITLPAEITDFAAAVNWYVNDWFTRLLAELEERVVKPVAGLGSGPNANGSKNLNAVSQQAIDTVKNQINAIDPDFWHSYGGSGGKLDVASTLRDSIEAAFAPLEHEVFALLEETNRQRQGQEEKLAALNQTLADTRQQITFLSDRLKAIESPFGPLPLRLTDLIKLFPLLLVALAVKLAMVMREGALQKSLFLQMADGGTETTSQLRRYQLRSVLLGPSSRLLGLAAMSAWLTALLAVFSRSAWLISSKQQIIMDSGGQEVLSLNPQIYQSGCLAGLALLAGAAAVMLKICWQSASSTVARPRRHKG